MNKTLITFFTVLFCLTSSVGWSLEFKDLVYRDGLYYKKFTEVPFTGKITGKTIGSFKNGKEDGSWVYYHDNGQLDSKGDYKNGNGDGFWIGYYENGQLKSKGNWKNGKKDGSWFNYYQNGQLDSKGDYKNGKKEGSWVSYYTNGQLDYKGEYKNGKQEGSWVWYDENGTIITELLTGTYKDGKKISD